MVELKVYDNGSVNRTEVDASLFGSRVLGRTLKDAVVMYEANRRQGTAQAKMEALREAGARVAVNPTEAGQMMTQVVHSLPRSF